MLRYSILINTTDTFEDCWEPFFILFKKYWPNYIGKIYLNTEFKDYSHSGLNIICVKNSINNSNFKLSWSECLKIALNNIDDDIILYLQEDYFLKDFVKNDIINDIYKIMKKFNEIECIHLTSSSGIISDKSIYNDNLYKIINPQRYFVSCQAAFWRKTFLFSILSKFENAWQFEEFASKRASKINPIFLRYFCNNNVIIPYILTGVVQGRWNEEVINLFLKNSINVDFSKRGFIKDTKPKSFIKKIVYILKKYNVLIKNNIFKN
jgi:hypothetical protein